MFTQLSVFCQILGKDITPEACCELQHAHEPSACFGCGAHSRLCAVCREYKPVCPEIGMCTACLGNQLRNERTVRRGDVRKQRGTTPCPIVEHAISAEMCLATQGDAGCHGCSSPFRLCEACAKRHVFFPAYGFCLRCAVEQYAPVWLTFRLAELRRLAPMLCDPRDAVSDPLAQGRAIALRNASRHVSAQLLSEELNLGITKAAALLSVLEREGVVSPSLGPGGKRRRAVRVERVPEAFLAATPPLVDYCEVCGKNPMRLRIDGRRLCLTCARRRYPARRWAPAAGVSLRQPEMFEQLVQEAGALLACEDLCSVEFLRRRMRLGPDLARRIIERLERKKIVGPKEPALKFARRVLVGGGNGAARQASTDAHRPRGPSLRRVAEVSRPLCGSCGIKSFCLRLRQKKFCLSCARRQFRRRWTYGLIGNPRRQEVLDRVYAEAVTFVRQHRVMTLRMLVHDSPLLVGDKIAQELLTRLEDNGIVSPRTHLPAVGHLVLSAEDREVTEDVRPKRRRRSVPDDPLLGEAILLVRERQQANLKLLKQHFHIGQRRASNLLHLLERRGAVHRTSWRVREVTVPPSAVKPETDPLRQIPELRRLIRLCGKGRTAMLLQRVIANLGKNVPA